jgi:multicomponent K+:H+ antiporter subunit G
MNDFIVGPLPLWAEILTAIFAVLGAAFAAIGSFGLVRLPTFFRRIHAPTLGATAGVWCMTAATIVYFSVQGNNLFLHAVLITLFVALTAPVTTIFLMRAALFRERQKGGDVPPVAPSTPASQPSDQA